MRTGRPGYALLMGVIGLVAISLMVAMAVTPNLAQARDQWRVEQTIEHLAWLTDSDAAIFRFNADLLAYPGTLSHLSGPITESDATLCGNAYDAVQTDDWAGRYAGRIYLEAGTPLPTGILQDTLEYDAGGPAMVLEVDLVREEQARRIDRRVDGSADGTAGRVRYGSADAEGLVTMKWRTTVSAC